MTLELIFLLNSSIKLTNSNFSYYTQGWSGNTITTSPNNYPSLTDSTQLQSIDLISGWDWKNGFMFSQSGSIDPLIQNIDLSLDSSLQDDVPSYQLTFDLLGNTDNNESISINFCGQEYNVLSGIDGRQQITLIPDVDAAQIITITPTSGFTGGITNITINKVNPNYQRVDLKDDTTLDLSFKIMTDVSTRGASYSKSLILPGTGNNNRIFNMLLDEHVWLNISGITDATSSTSIFLNKNIPAMITMNSIPVINGQFILTEVDVDGNEINYQGTFSSNVRSFADAIGDKKLTGNDDKSLDLDFSKYNHKFNFLNIIASHNPDSTMYKNSTGYYYPLLDMDGPNSMNLTILNQALIQNFRPSLYLSEILTMITSAAGWTFTGSTFLNSDYFKSLIIPMTFDTKNNFLHKNVNGLSDLDFQIGIPNTFTGYGNITARKPIPFYIPQRDLYATSTPYYSTTRNIPLVLTGGTSNINSQSYFVGSKVLITSTGCTNPLSNCTTYWQVTESGNYNLSITYDAKVYFEMLSSLNNGYMAGTWNNINGYIQITTDIMCLTAKGINKKLQTTTTQIPSVGDSALGYYFSSGTYMKDTNNQYDITSTITLQDSGEDLFQGDKLYVKVTIDSELSVPKADKPGLAYIWLNILSGTTFFSNEYNEKNYFYMNETVNMNTCLPPSTSQIDFIKDISNMFNLVYMEDKSNLNTLIVDTWDNFFGQGSTVDWSKKVDQSQEKTIESIPDLLYNDVWLTTKSDSNDTNLANYNTSYNREFGSVYLPNPYLKLDTKTISTNFSSTFLNTYGSTNWIMSQLYNKDKQPTSINIPSEETYNQRILFRQTVPNGISGITLSDLMVYGYSDFASTPGVGTGATNSMYFTESYWFGTHGFNYQPYAGHLYPNPYLPTQDVNYGLANYYYIKNKTTNNLYNTFWKNKLLTYLDPNSKYLTYYVWLNLNDISSLDFRNKILIDGNLYYLMKINGWTPGNSTKIELIKVSDYPAYFNQDPNNWKSTILPTKQILSKPPVIELINKRSIIYDESVSGQTYNIANTYPQNAAGLIIGEGNTINSNNYLVDGNYNTVNSDNTILFNSNNNIIPTGLTNVVMFNTTGITVTDSNTTYINNVKFDLYENILNYKISEIAFSESPFIIPLPVGNVLINIYNDLITDLSGQTFNITLDQDLKYRQSVDIEILSDIALYTNKLNFNIMFYDANYDDITEQLLFGNISTPIDISIYNEIDPDQSTFNNSYYYSVATYIDRVTTGVSYITTTLSGYTYGSGNAPIIETTYLSGTSLLDIKSSLFNNNDWVYIEDFYFLSGTTMIDLSGLYFIINIKGIQMIINLNIDNLQLKLVGNPKIRYYNGLKVSIKRTNNSDYSDIKQRYLISKEY